MTLSPIVLFVYNRPVHAQRTLEALSKNKLAEQSVLYIYADGPRENADKFVLNEIQETREVLRSKKWCKEVIIIERETNLGLSQSVYAGVSEVLKKYDRIIVLEDDIVTSTSFLKFMNKALDLYKEDQDVYQISGFMIPNNEGLPSTFFYRAPASWGWATWKRAWDYYIDDANILIDKLDQADLYRFNIDNTYDYDSLLPGHWDARWYASVFLRNGLCLWPARSLVRNIGHDGTGQNCSPNQSYYLNQKIHTKFNLKIKEPVESVKAVEIFKRFYRDRHAFLDSQHSAQKFYLKYNKIKSKLKSNLFNK